MKKLEELALGTADVSAITSDMVSDYILKKRDTQVVFSQLFKKVSIPDGFSGVETPKLPTTSLTINLNVSQGDTLKASSYRYEANTITPRKMGLYVPVSTEAWESANRDIITELIDELSSEIVKHQDLRAMTVALDIKTGTLTESDFVEGTLADSDNQPFIEIISSTFDTGSISSVDYGDGKVLVSDSITTGTVVYTYSNRVESNYYTSVADAQTLKVSDILMARGIMKASSINPDVVLCNDRDIVDVWYNAASSGVLLPKRAYVDREGILNGELGMILDLKLLASPNVPEGLCILADSSRLGYNGIKRDLWSIVEEEYGWDEKRLRVWTENDYDIADTLSVGIVTNFKRGLYQAADL